MRPSGFAAFKDAEGGFGSGDNNGVPHGGGKTAAGNVQMGQSSRRDLYDYGDNDYDDFPHIHRYPNGTEHSRHNLY